jgi:hypothetical protein
VSLSITFRTAASERFENAYRFNARLGRLGTRFGTPGRWSALDGVQSAVVLASDRRKKRVLGRRVSPPPAGPGRARLQWSDRVVAQLG